MSVNNPKQEYRTREEYKRAKADALQRKKDAETHAKDEANRTKDAGKHSKEEVRRKQQAEKQTKDEAHGTQDAAQPFRNVAQGAQDVAKQSKNVAKGALGAAKLAQNVARGTQKAAKSVVNAAKPTSSKEPRQKQDNGKTKRNKDAEVSSSREAQRAKAAKTVDTKGKDPQAGETTPAKYQRVRIRLVPIWLRLVLLVAFMFISVAVGAIVGYGLIGGGNVSEVFQQSTWTHIIDLVDKGKK